MYHPSGRFSYHPFFFFSSCGNTFSSSSIVDVSVVLMLVLFNPFPLVLVSFLNLNDGGFLFLMAAFGDDRLLVPKNSQPHTSANNTDVVRRRRVDTFIVLLRR